MRNLPFSKKKRGKGGGRDWEESRENERYLIKASDMVQWLKMLAAEPDSLSSIPGTHVVEGEN